MTSTPTTGQLAWVTDPVDPGALGASGVHVVAFSEIVEHASRIGPSDGGTIDDPHRPIIDPLLAHDAVAVLDVHLRTVRDVQVLHDLVLRPVLGAGVPLLIHADRTLDELDDQAFIDDGFACPYTLERARWIAAVAQAGSGAIHPAEPGAPADTLDPEQAAAANAPGGVAQIIAPAGAGKTTTLIARARTLLRRGISPDEILVCTFNAAAAVELNDRLRDAHVRVEAMTFHSLGRRLLGDEFAKLELVTALTVPQWQRLAIQARKQFGVDPPEPTELPGLISDLKLGALHLPAEALAAAEDPQETAVARVYQLLEDHLATEGKFMFDDMIFRSVRRLREDAAFRARWQQRWTAVLVDEYQDIEPAQELLVRLLAAPHDEITVVGDDDQMLYRFRRADVSTMLGFDRAYPGLTRVALKTNYRCAPEHVTAADQLIAHNRRRFPKTIRPRPGRQREGDRALRAVALTEQQIAAMLPQRLRGRSRKDIVCLARTVDTLRPYALAAAEHGLRIDGPPEMFESSGPLRTVEAYATMFANPACATVQDAGHVLRRPASGITDDRLVRAFLDVVRRGARPSQAIADLNIPDGNRRTKAAAAAQTFARLEKLTGDAGAFLKALRASGLDDYYEQAAAASGMPDASPVELLARCEDEARGRPLADYDTDLKDRAGKLQRARDPDHGIELTTVHRAKGRQWHTVLVLGCQEGLMPHAAALKQDPRDGLEDERRVAYVAFTRATHELSVLYEPDNHSRFLNEAGLISTPATITAPQTRPALPGRGTAGTGYWSQGATGTRTVADREPPPREVTTVLAHVGRAGLLPAFQRVLDPDLAVEVLAHVLRQPADLTVHKPVGNAQKTINALRGLPTDTRVALLAALGRAGHLTRSFTSLPHSTRQALLEALAHSSR